MPGMDGLTFCRQIKNKNIFKVLLTGAASEKLAVEAFNSRLINAFITKHESNIYDSIQKCIQEGLEEYFQTISRQFFIALEDDCHSDFIRDYQFSGFFREFLKLNNIVEFYLIQGTGSYLRLN